MVVHGRPEVLLVSGAGAEIEHLAVALEERDHVVRRVAVDEALVMAAAPTVDAVLVALSSNGAELDLLARLRRQAPSLARGVLAAADLSPATFVQALRAGMEDCFLPPVEVEAVAAFLQHALDRKVLARELEISRERYRLVAEIAGDGIVVVEESGKIDYWNPAAGQLFGRDLVEAYGRMLDDLLGLPGFVAGMRKAAGGGACPLDIVVRRPDGTSVPVECSTAGMVVYGRWQGVCVFRDVSVRKRHEEELRRSRAELARQHRQLQEAQARLVERERLAAVGQLAAGLAHEINNPMAFVYSNLRVLERYVRLLGERARSTQGKDGVRTDPRLAFVLEDIDSLLQETVEGAERIREIIANLQKFGQGEQRRLVDLGPVVEGALAMIRGLVGGKGRIVRQGPTSLPPVCCVASEIGQVLLNILFNAVDAIGTGGVITVATFVDGTWVGIRITDSGAGIEPASRERIFDPFFTTKAAGEGPGLGLAICREIVHRHEGRIHVRSAPGVGASFTVLLPVASVASCP